MQTAHAIVINGMVCRCERDDTLFVAAPRTYLRANPRDPEHIKIGVRFVDCPRCDRRYFDDGKGGWNADRPLTVVQKY